MNAAAGRAQLRAGGNSMTEAPSGVAPTGVTGLDHIMAGGFVRNRLYLIEGVPGSGKTTLALQFLRDGASRGEPVLYVTLSETAQELRAAAHSHGWDLEGIAIHELIPSAETLDREQQLSIFHPAEVELGTTTNAILSAVERVKPQRIVFDSLSEMRLLAATQLRFRRQVLALKQYFSAQGSTVLLLDDNTATEPDQQIHSIAHATLTLEQLLPEYGADRRRLRVGKYRGVAFRGGYHDYVIHYGGLQVFPRSLAAEIRRAAQWPTLSTGVSELDALLGGGVDCGTSTLIAGAAGAGKSTLATSIALSAASTGKKAALFLFDESLSTFLKRANGLGMKLQPHLDSGAITVQQVDPAELSPGEFAAQVRSAAERDGASVIVIDSLNGYLNAMPGERFLAIQLHELLAYLGELGVATLLVGVQPGLVGASMATVIDASYLADGVILLRYFEADSEVRLAISVVKKRSGVHERTIREMRIDNGIRIGAPLREFRGVLSGTPHYRGPNEPLQRKT
jgi:circadian clock protein KaiC